MEVLETLASEGIISARMLKFVERWKANDPPSAAQYDVSALEFDPIKINQEVGAYHELLLRDRVNQAARAVTLAFSTGTDLDAIATRYPGGVPRLSGESDDRYRRRIWLSPNLLSPHGTFEAYVFWALTADPLLRDASADTIQGTGKVIVTVMAEGDVPKPTAQQLENVRVYIQSLARQALTDIIIVQAPTIVETNYRIKVWLYPGIDQTTMMADLRTAVDGLIEQQRWLGGDHMHSAIDGVMGQSGVHHCIIEEPATDLRVRPSGLVRVKAVSLIFMGRDE